MKSTQKRKKKIRSAQERALWELGIFHHKVERDRTKFNRKKKHKHLED